MTTKAKKPRTTRNRETTNTEPSTAADAAQETDRPIDAKSKKGTEKRRIVSVGFPSKTARQLHLLSSVSGETIASIVIGAVTRTIAKRLPDALAEVAKADADE